MKEYLLIVAAILSRNIVGVFFVFYDIDIALEISVISTQ